MSVPNDPLGCTNATVVPRDPGRGAVSIGVAPASTMAASAAAQSSTRYPTWWSPSPRFSRYLAIGESGRVADGELDVAVGDLDQRLLHPVGVDDLAMVDLGPEGAGVVVDRGVEVVDGDGDVVDLGELHGP